MTGTKIHEGKWESHLTRGNPKTKVWRTPCEVSPLYTPQMPRMIRKGDDLKQDTKPKRTTQETL